VNRAIRLVRKEKKMKKDRIVKMNKNIGISALNLLTLPLLPPLLQS